MSEFIEECRREWRRLGVPDPIANEMAADLTADLDEAEAEGGSPEDVLGNSAFDPQRFAAAWATARGVTGPSTPHRLPPWRRPVAIALTALFGVLTVIAGLALLSGRSSSSVAFASPRTIAESGPIRLFGPGSRRIAIPGPLGSVVATGVAHVNAHPILWILFFMVVMGVLGIGILAVLYWMPWSALRRYGRHKGPPSPNWN